MDDDQFFESILATENNYHFKPLKTIPYSAVHAVVSFLISVIGAILAFFWKGDTECEEYFIILYIRCIFWMVTFETNQKAIIPQKWILNLDFETLLNYGLKFVKKKVFKVFISNVFGAEPDFHLDVISILDTQRPACYNAYIVKTFDTLELGLAHRSQVAQSDRQLNIAELDDSDIDAIQQILDDSDDENEDVVTICRNGEFAWPLKPTIE